MGQLTADKRQTRVSQQVGCVAESSSGCCSASLTATTVLHPDGVSAKDLDNVHEQHG